MRFLLLAAAVGLVLGAVSACEAPGEKSAQEALARVRVLKASGDVKATAVAAHALVVGYPQTKAAQTAKEISDEADAALAEMDKAEEEALKAKRDLLEKQLADLKARRQRESDKIAASGSILSALKPNVDDMKRVTWYRAKGEKFVLGSWLRFYFGVGEDGGLKTLYPLRLKVQLENSNWIFAKKAIFMVDGRTFEIAPEEWGHENYSDTVWETADVSLSTMNPELMQALVSGREVKVRYEGRERVKDVRVSPKQLDFAKEVYAAWSKVKLDEPESK